jgi:hypothetical protein
MSLIKPITPLEFSRDPFGVFYGCGYKVLAQGDSWFSIGALNPFNSNLLFEIDTPTQIGVVNCAYPGRTLAHMVDQVQDKTWLHLLNDKSSNWRWDALFFSAGGNDLIDAVQSTYEAAAGDPARRLLLRADEWDPQRPVPQRYLSEQGWNTFVTHITALFEHLVALRDSPQSAAAGAPLFLHTYNQPTPRDAPALPGVAGPWLYKAVTDYAIPPEDWNALADELIARLAALLKGLGTAWPNVHVFDSSQVPLQRAEPGTRGPSGDWINEIHLTHAGYRKLGRPWGALIAAELP